MSSSPEPATTAAMRDALLAAAGERVPCPQERFSGRGIVVCAGGPRMFTCAYVCIGILKRVLRCALPIEVWYIGDAEMGPPMRGLLDALGTETVDAVAVGKRHGVQVLGGWELKAFALLHSRFREILLLDADNIPAADPSFLFDSDEYRATGAIFWPDLVRVRRDSPIWSISGVTYRDMPSVESGELIVDKVRCWDGLRLANWINQRSSFFYQHVYGDKDTFLFAWLILGLPFHMIRHPPKRLPLTLCQRAFDGSVLFQHRNEQKWSIHGVNRRSDGFRHEEECFALLDELRQKWDGRVFNPPPRPENAREIEERLKAQRRFLFTRVGQGTTSIELLRDHRIDRASHDWGFYWYVQERDGEASLVLEVNGRQLYALAPAEDGSWSGRRSGEDVPVELAPAEAPADAPASDAGLRRLLEHILSNFATSCRDSEVLRDLVGTVRTLALLDPGVAAFVAAEATASGGDARARLLHLAMAGLSERNLVDPGAVRAGARSDPSLLLLLYERVKDE